MSSGRSSVATNMIRQRSEFMFPNIVLLYYSRTLYVRGEQTCVFCVAAAGSTAVVRVGRSGSKAFARRRRHPPELEFERKSTRLLSASLPFRTLRQRGGASPNPPPPPSCVAGPSSFGTPIFVRTKEGGARDVSSYCCAVPY